MPAQPSTSAPPGRSFTTIYLIFYNSFSCLLWGHILLRVCHQLLTASPSTVFSDIGASAKWTETFAILEIVHVLLGFVKSRLQTTVTQVGGRMFVIWAICERYQEAQRTAAYPGMLLAWSITEVCRYSYYVVNLTGKENKMLAWLRYNLFFVLYPLGAGSEFMCIVAALPQVWDSGSRTFYWFLIVVLCTYPPALFAQYTHMMALRRKQMRGKKVKN